MPRSSCIPPRLVVRFWKIIHHRSTGMWRTLEDFIKWFTLDPDSDAILESDAEICDRVQSYLENNYPIEDGDKFFTLVDKFNEKGIANKWAKRAYELLFKEAPGTMEHAYLGLKVLYKEETRECKPRNVRKSVKTSAK